MREYEKRIVSGLETTRPGCRCGLQSFRKVAIVAGDAPFLISKPFLQRMGAVLDLEQGQVTFNKLGVTLNLEESATDHNAIADGSTRENASGSGKRNESGKDSEDAVDKSEFSNLICGSEK